MWSTSPYYVKLKNLPVLKGLYNLRYKQFTSQLTNLFLSGNVTFKKIHDF